MGSFNCRKRNTIPIINSPFKGFSPPPASGKSSSDCLAPHCWRPQLTLQSDTLPRAPHQNRSHLFIQTPPVTLPHCTERFLFLFAMEGNVCPSQRSSLPGLEGEHLFRCSAGREPKLWSKWYWEVTKEKLLSPLKQQVIFEADLALWWEPCLMWSI